MTKIPKRSLVIGIIILTLLSIIFGLVLYSLSDIPFGNIFQIVFFIFSFSLMLTMITLTLLCFKSEKRLLTCLGIVPLLLAILVISVSLILIIDYRMLYFESIPPEPSETEWVEDLHYLTNQLITKHADLHALVSEKKMTATVKEIENQIPDMSNAEILMALFKIIALPNDGHTFPFIMIPAFDLRSFPFKVYLFPEGLHVVDAGREYKDLIGARILQIGSQCTEDIFNNYPLFLAAENSSSYKERFTYMVMMAEWLFYHGIIRETGKAEFLMMKRNGDEVALTIPSVRFYQHYLWSGIFPIDNEAPPVFTNYREDYYHYKLLRDKKTIYIQFNQSMDQPGRKTMKQFTENLINDIVSINLDRCIVDLRNNDGGSPVWADLLQFLKEHKTFNQHGHLFVLIGRHTFSSAVVFATRLQLQTNAIFVGEPTGQGPLFYSRPDLIELPHSRLPFSVSRHLTVAGLPFDRRKALHPDISVKYSVADFLEGSDPVLQAALTYIPSQKPVKHLQPGILDKYTGRYLLTPTQIMDISNEGNYLKVYLSDFLESSGFDFESRLYPVSENIFNTHIDDVTLEFPIFSGERPDSVFLNWMGVRHSLKAASLEYVSAFEKFSTGEIGEGCELLSARRESYVAEYADLEFIMNRLGYIHLRKGEISAALQIFRLNVNLFPRSYNVYDSYGESLMVNDQIELAIENYKKSLELNPNNKNAERVIQVLMNK